MTDSPKISIVIPVYNAAGFLGQLMDSILAQTFSDFEVICVENGSTDASRSLLEDYAAKDARIRIVTQENRGPGVARNTGLAQARGEYILFFDADDFVSKHLIEKAYARAKDSGADIVIYQARHHDTKDGSSRPSPDRWDPNQFPPELSREDAPDQLFGAFKNWPWDKMFRTDFLRENRIEFPALYRTEDLLFTCSALVLAKKIALLDEELYNYRVNNPESSTSTNDFAPLDFYESAKLLKAFLEDRGLFEEMKRGYVNWIALCVLVNLFGLKTPEAFVDVYSTMHDEGVRNLGLADAPKSLFDDPGQYDLIQIVLDHDVATGTFLLWQFDKHRMEDRLQQEVTNVTDSTTFRVGSAILGLPTRLKDRFSR